MEPEPFVTPIQFAKQNQISSGRGHHLKQTFTCTLRARVTLICSFCRIDSTGLSSAVAVESARVKGLSRQPWIHTCTMLLDLCLSVSLHNKHRRVHTDTTDYTFSPSHHVHFHFQRVHSKATRCSFRKVACSTTSTIRQNAGNHSGKPTSSYRRRANARVSIYAATTA